MLENFSRTVRNYVPSSIPIPPEHYSTIYPITFVESLCRSLFTDCIGYIVLDKLLIADERLHTHIAVRRRL
jgi:hypothetical protein